MAHLLRQRMVSLLGLLAGCAVLPAAVVHFFGKTEVQIPSPAHFLPIGISAGLAAAAAVVLTLEGARRGDARAVVIGTAFSSMAALLSIHGLTTPGFLVGDNGLVAFSGALTLPMGGAVLALSTIPELRRPTAVRPVLALQGGLLVAIVGLGLVGMLAHPGRLRRLRRAAVKAGLPSRLDPRGRPGAAQQGVRDRFRPSVCRGARARARARAARGRARGRLIDRRPGRPVASGV